MLRCEGRYAGLPRQALAVPHVQVLALAERSHGPEHHGSPAVPGRLHVLLVPVSGRLDVGDPALRRLLPGAH